MINYALPTSIAIEGTEYPINADFRAVLDIITALNDPALTEQEKAYISLYIFYKGNIPYDALEPAIERMMEFMSAGTDDSSTNAPEIVDWEQDFGMIISAVNRVLGTECRALPFLHWYTFISAYMEIGECLFSTVLGIRDKKARGKKLEKYEQDFVKRNPQYFKRKNAKYEEDIAEMIRSGDLCLTAEDMTAP